LNYVSWPEVGEGFLSKGKRFKKVLEMVFSLIQPENGAFLRLATSIIVSTSLVFIRKKKKKRAK
jgi:hypothetical protein